MPHKMAYSKEKTLQCERFEPVPLIVDFFFNGILQLLERLCSHIPKDSLNKIIDHYTRAEHVIDIPFYCGKAKCRARHREHSSDNASKTYRQQSCDLSQKAIASLRVKKRIIIFRFCQC